MELHMNTFLNKKYDVVIVGGGISGICAAISAARYGAKTALLHDRPVLGGNASSEIRMHICGASCHGNRTNARETGILEEILLENKHRNPTHSYAIFDAVLWEKAHYQENLDLYLNTYMYEVNADRKKIHSVTARQLTTEKGFIFVADMFIDCSGDALLSYLAGAEYMFGREDVNTFKEPNAVKAADRVTMGNTIQFIGRDVGYPVKFERPFWAHNYRNEEWIKKIKFVEFCGIWWIEVGGTELDVIKDSDEIYEELLKVVYGIWDYIKNCLDDRANNFALEWVGALPGKRESRRVIGDYILREQDLIEGAPFDDAVAYGGWHIDMHMSERFYSMTQGRQHTEDIPVELKDIYQIPYRCLYAKDFDNLFLGGRIISASHRAFASTRVMGTCAVVGEAVGLASAMASKFGCTARKIGTDKIEELQQILLKNDCYIPGLKNNDQKDFARFAQICSSSQTIHGKCENIINGTSRSTIHENNFWESEAIQGKNPWISLQFKTPIKVDTIILIFDSDLSREIMISISPWAHDRQSPFTPETLVKDYTVVFMLNGQVIYRDDVKGNYLRRRVHSLPRPIECDSIRIDVSSTNGSESVRIFEVRVY